ncbi:hypothetical protein MARBORIA2_18380 [Methanobrevibacter arboriphilus]|jgi:hypothetical protein|uniref:DUF4041 domain-containing protein n=1 Tax=Methanobrevibacter arboriphilus TaxID=39441 RepID=UPI0022EDE8D8|nr:DUF4041 domain-containing protein [Methanobrevibacter arboriphilus]GLI12748.1 hypothetical protein MARBORIA2_18380 [Methanobrevibacter arboriphilus]
MGEEKVPKFCFNCGNPLDENSKFCKKCGTLISKTENEENKNNENKEKEQIVNETEKNQEKTSTLNIKENKGLIIIIIGILFSITLYGIFIGIPLIIIGVYYLNKKVNEKEKQMDNKLKEKQDQIANIDIKLNELEKAKEKEINEKLNDKKEELANIDIKLEKMENDKEKEINEKLADKKDELANIDIKLDEMEKEKTKEINIKLEQKENDLANIDAQLEETAKAKQEEINIKLKDKGIQLDNIINELKEKQKELIFIEEELEWQEIGLYEPKYNFSTALLYKERLDEIRKKQKDMIKNKTAVIGGDNWTVDGSKRKGQAMNNANKKLLIKNFNLECDTIISKVKLSNMENSVKRINKAFETLNRLNERNLINITSRYLNLKLEELNVAIEYELKKQEEKEILRETREREREERKIQKQLDAQLKSVNKHKMQLETEMEATNNLLQRSESDEEIELLKNKLKELELAIEKSNNDEKDIAEKRKRTGAGYVYILSNVGSFGENIYKIGVTRRDDPYGRITELSDASVPFRFDHQVFIFSEEAFELEKELHNRFDHKRVNKVNRRKEFFHITIDDVKRIVDENKDLVHSFSVKPEAQEYYDTLKIEKSNSKLL